MEVVSVSLNPRVHFLAAAADDDDEGLGQIEFEEFARAMSAKVYRKYSEDDLRLAFRQLDQDNSGYIQAKELEAVLQRMGRRLSKAEIDSMVKTLDTTGDGKISFEEFRQLF